VNSKILKLWRTPRRELPDADLMEASDSPKVESNVKHHRNLTGGKCLEVPCNFVGINVDGIPRVIAEGEHKARLLAFDVRFADSPAHLMGNLAMVAEGAIESQKEEGHADRERGCNKAPLRPTACDYAVADNEYDRRKQAKGKEKGSHVHSTKRVIVRLTRTRSATAAGSEFCFN